MSSNTSILLEFKRASQRLRDEYDELKEQYPEQWVAVSKNGLVSHSMNLDEVISGFQVAGYEKNQVVVKFLALDPRLMIL